MTDPRDSTRDLMAHAPKKGHAGSAGDGNLAEPMPLGSFLHGIANIYDLAPKEVEPKVEAPKVVKPKKRFSRPIGVMLALSVAALFTVEVSSGTTRGALPVILHGEWQTDFPAYRNRRFTLAESEITFKIGSDKDSVTVHQVRRVEETATGEDRKRFVVDYDVEGAAATWKFQYIWNGMSPVIRFDNQNDIIWTPVPLSKIPPR
jgi:hypothetical protein